MTIRSVLADDEPLARERLRRLMEVDPEFQIVGECRNGKEVVQTLLGGDVDLLMLDIRMPGLDGFQVMKEMSGRKMPLVVFVTAHEQYAIQAFQVHALDYVLKPIDPARLEETMERVKERAAMEAALVTQERFASALTALETLAASEPRRARFLVRSGSKDVFVPTGEITWIEAADYYVCLHVDERKYLLRESIKKLEAELDPRQFVRIHRSAIVNVEAVREIHREGRSEGWVLLANGDRVRMSMAGWQKLLSAGQG